MELERNIALPGEAQGPLGGSEELSRSMQSEGARLRALLLRAQEDLSQIDSRRQGLLSSISKLQAAIAALEGSEDQELPGHLTLHEAMEQVLASHENAWMSVRDLTDAITERDLYTKRSGAPVDLNQVRARATNYPEQFERGEGGLIRLRNWRGPTHEIPSRDKGFPFVTVPVTPGGLRNGYLSLSRTLDFFPPDAIGGPSRDEAGRWVILRGKGLNEFVRTDIAGDKRFFRNRSFIRRFLAHHDLKEGDQVRISRIGDREFALEPQR